MSVVATLLAGALFGLALAAPPGPMNAIIAEESVARGWSAGFRAGLGAMVADACFFVGALLGVVAVVRRYPLVHAALVGVGGLLMLYFGYGAAAELRSGFGATDAAGKGFRKAFALALTNPYQIVFWLTGGVALLAPGTLDVLAPLSGALAGRLVVETGSPALVVGLFGGIGVWIVGFPAALVAAEHRVDAIAPVVAAVSALVLGGFGAYFLLDAARTAL
jgi:threonine/homoserine/homoserine lactone efflux protein